MESVLRAHIESGSFHHGYLLAGNFEISRKMAMEAARAILEFQGLPLDSNPDFFYRSFELFSVTDSRELSERASQKPFSGDKKVFVVEIFSFSVESANALLKTFEEPYEGTHFFVIVPSIEDIIPTLRSRLVVIDLLAREPRSLASVETAVLGGKFLADLPSARLEIIQKISKDKQKAVDFLNELEVNLEKKLGSSTPTWELNSQAGVELEEIQKCREFLYQRGGSAKMVLEYLALSLPRLMLK